VLLYAPTGQKHNSLETVGEEVIRRLRATGRYDILIKLHDHPRDHSVDWPRQLRPLLDAHTKLVRDFDIVPYLFVADLLISDASSVSSEYSLLDRPMVFLDVPDMIQAMRAKGRAVDLETWGRKGGVTVRWPDEAVEAVRDSLAHPRRGSEVRRAMAQDLFFNPGRAAVAVGGWFASTRVGPASLDWESVPPLEAQALSLTLPTGKQKWWMVARGDSIAARVDGGTPLRVEVSLAVAAATHRQRAVRGCGLGGRGRPRLGRFHRHPRLQCGAERAGRRRPRPPGIHPPPRPPHRSGHARGRPRRRAAGAYPPSRVALSPAPRAGKISIRTLSF
jgi:hypothetical protein